jgi:hypothetical protein
MIVVFVIVTFPTHNKHAITRAPNPTHPLTCIFFPALFVAVAEAVLPVAVPVSVWLAELELAVPVGVTLAPKSGN